MFEGTFFVIPKSPPIKAEVMPLLHSLYRHYAYPAKDIRTNTPTRQDETLHKKRKECLFRGRIPFFVERNGYSYTL